MNNNRYIRLSINGDQHWMTQCSSPQSDVPVRSIVNMDMGISEFDTCQTNENRMSRYRYYTQSIYSNVFDISILSCDNSYKAQSFYRHIASHQWISPLQNSEDRINQNDAIKDYRQINVMTNSMIGDELEDGEARWDKVY